MLIVDTAHSLSWWRYFIGHKSLSLLLVTATCLHDLQPAIFFLIFRHALKIYYSNQSKIFSKFMTNIGRSSSNTIFPWQSSLHLFKTEVMKPITWAEQYFVLHPKVMESHEEPRKCHDQFHWAYDHILNSCSRTTKTIHEGFVNHTIPCFSDDHFLWCCYVGFSQAFEFLLWAWGDDCPATNCSICSSVYSMTSQRIIDSMMVSAKFHYMAIEPFHEWIC